MGSGCIIASGLLYTTCKCIIYIISNCSTISTRCGGISYVNIMSVVGNYKPWKCGEKR